MSSLFISQIFIISTCLAYAQSSVQVQVNDPRPLKTAIDQLESAVGVPISYEDPPFEYAGDIQDVTDQVQSVRQRAANPNVRILVPKGGSLALDLGPLPKPLPVSSALSLVSQLRAAHEASNFPGRFEAKQVGSILAVEPTATRGPDGNWKAVKPVMETHISFPSQQRGAAETLALIAAQTTQAVRIKVGIGRFPILAFANTTVT